MKDTLLPKVEEILKDEPTGERIGTALEMLPFNNSSQNGEQNEEEEEEEEEKEDEPLHPDDLFEDKEKSEEKVDTEDIIKDVKGGTEGTDSGKDKKKNVIAGAVAVTVVENRSQALTDDGATVIAGRNADVASSMKTDVSTSGDGRAAGPAGTDVDTALGAGIAVAVVDGESRADVKGSVSAEGNVNVTSASTGKVKTDAKAGYSKGDIGIGGAVAVQIASLDSKALAHNTVDIKTDGILSMDADTDVSFSVNSDASGKTSKNAGIGAGVAVAVGGADTYAAIQDGAKLSAKTESGSVGGVSATAASKLLDFMKALSGAAGGTSVVPAAVVNVTGTETQAYLGRISDGPMEIKGDVKASAKTDAVHQMKADAYASGKGTAVGTGISVSVVSDVANARLNQSVNAKNVTVDSTTTSSVTNNVKAASSGGRKDQNKDADKQADGLADAAGKLAEKNKSKSVSPDQIEKAKSENRQQAQTSEGSIGVAGAVVVNVQNSAAVSLILEGVNVKAAETLAVTAQNGTTSKVMADASTTNSDIGVGAGVAVNIIGLKNIARISDGEIEAAVFKVTANTKLNKAEELDDKEVLRRKIEEDVEGFIDELLKETGINQFMTPEKVEELKASMRVGLQELAGELSQLNIEEIKTRIIKELRGAANKALFSVSSEIISALSEQFDLFLKSKPKTTGHVIDTQAVSGAGVRDVGVAGSVAITVLNAETSATIADMSEGGSTGRIKVTNDMTVDADELRSVNNVASAAIDKKGKAVANKNASITQIMDAVSGNDAESIAKNSIGNVKLTVGVGGTAEINKEDEDSNRPRMYIKLKDGYQMPADNKVFYSFDDGSGFETSGDLTAQKDSDGRWYVDTDIEEFSKGILTSQISLEVRPVAIEYAVPAPSVLTTDSEESGKVTYKAGGIGPLDGKLTAHVGDRVEVRIEKKPGRMVSKIFYGYTDKDGSYKEAQLARGSENDKEIIYVFDMPAANLERFVVAFDDAAEQSAASTKDGTGRSVGVGAAFSMVYGESKTAAKIGVRSSIDAGELSVTAASSHEEDIASVAGTDPLTGQADLNGVKDIAVDASVALNMMDNQIKAAVNETTPVITNGHGENDEQNNGDLTVTAGETSRTKTTASAFSAGDRTAVGASAVVNIASTAVDVEIAGGQMATGSVNVSANSHNEDNTHAIATAMGADIANNLKKLGQTTEEIKKKANSLLNGSIVDSLDKDGKRGENKTADMINDRLDEKKKEGAADASSYNSLSSNVLRTQDAKTEGQDAGGEGTKEAQEQIEANTGTATGNVGGDTKTKVQVAAAVGVTVASHEAAVKIGNIKAGGSISAAAENTGNFNTLGTGAAMSFAEHADSIALGAAVSVNKNTAKVNTGNLNGGDISVSSRLTQNMDGDYLGKLAAQSLSGSVAGNGSHFSLSGAVSVVDSQAKSTVDMAGKKIQGGQVAFEATEKSKLAARAGGVSLSKGSSLGMGIASTTIVSANDVTASVGDNVEITADSFRLNAEKQAVTDEDFKQLINLRDLITDSSAMTDEQRAKAETGLIDMHKADDGSYTIDVNLSSEKLLNAVEGLNFLSSQNTYAEAIAGSIASGNTDANLAGSFAVAVTDNNVHARLGDGVVINAKGGDVSVTAADGTTTRIIAGSLAAAPAKTSVGVTEAVLINSDKASAQTGADSRINAYSITHTAEQTGDAQVFTAAMAVAAGAEADAAAGGAVNVIINKSAAESRIGDSAVLNTVDSSSDMDGSIDIHSNVKYDLMLISGSANVTTGGTIAAGGTVNVIVDKAEARTRIGEKTSIDADDSLNIASDVSDQLISGAASASVAASASGMSGAGAVNVMVSRSLADTTIGKGAEVKTEYHDLKINANNDAWMLNASLAAAGSGSIAIGGAFNVNVFDRQAIVNVEESSLSSHRDLFVQSSGRDTDIMAGLALAGSISGAVLSGNTDVMVESNRIHTVFADGVLASAKGNAVLESYYSDYTLDAAGSITGSYSGPTIGVTGLVMVKNNDVRTQLGAGTVNSFVSGDGSVTTLNGEAVSGLYVGANAVETLFLAAAGVALSGSASVNGVVDVLVNNNSVIADASKAVLSADTSSIAVKAADDTRHLLLAGGVNTSVSSGVGASVATLVSNKTVKALAHDMTANSDIIVQADNRDDVSMLALSAGISGSAAVAIGAAVQVLSSSAIAEIDGAVTVHGGGVNVSSDNTANLSNTALALGIGGNVAVTPVGVVTVFGGESRADIKSGSMIETVNDVAIKAAGNKSIGLYSIGAAAGGTAAVSGTANVLIARDVTRALVERDASIHSDKGSLNLDATGDYRLTSATAAVGAAATVGVAVNAVVSILKSSTVAELGGKADVAGDVNIRSGAVRDVANFGANLSAGTVGVGVNAMVLVSGTKMSQDAADMIAYGNSDSKNDNSRTFDAAAFLKTDGILQERTEYERDENGDYVLNEDGSRKTKKVSNIDTDAISDDLSGNGHYESQQQVGSTTGDGDSRQGIFDGASGYRSGDFDDPDFDDNGKVQRGENLGVNPDGSQADLDTQDVKNAKAINSYTYEGEPEDAVIARITKDGSISKAENVTIEAVQPVTADMLGVSGSGAAIGVGVTTAVAILHSNALAESLGSIQKVSGDVSLSAKSVSNGDVSDQAEALNNVLNGLVPDSGGIRVVGAALGAGAVGVAVGASVALTDNVTAATLGGTVEKANNINVSGTHDYGHVVAATGTLTAGAIAVGAAVAVAQTEGEVCAGINGNVTADGDLNVTTESKVSAEALTATAGAGAIAVNAGVALAINRLAQNTGISGASVRALNVNVKASSDSSADSELLGVSVGGVGVALSAAVSQVNAKLDTYVKNADVSAANVEVFSDVASTAIPRILSMAAGGVAAGGNVLLAFNETESHAHITDSIIKATDLYVTADLAGEAISKLTAEQVGAIAAGVSVNYADMRADNRAVVENSNVTVDHLSVVTGKGEHSSTIAVAESTAGNIGLATVGVNTAIARNNTRSFAVVNCDNIYVKWSFSVESTDSVGANATVKGTDIGGASTGLSVAVALNDAETRSQVNLTQLDGLSPETNIRVNHNADTNATIVTGGGSLLEAKANVGVAYGRSTAVVDASIGKINTLLINALNESRSTTNTVITNESFGFISAAVMASAAYSQDRFDSRLKLGSGDSGDIKVSNTYDISANADVTPSAGGVKASVAELALNLAIARSTAYAGSQVTVENGSVIADYVEVLTNGGSTTNAVINPAKVTVSGVNVGANYANSDLSMTQEAKIILNGGSLEYDYREGNMDVKAVSSNAQANASVGAAGADRNISISLMNLAASHAYARENLTSTAGIYGKDKGGKVKAGSLNVYAGMAESDPQEKLTGQNDLVNSLASAVSQGARNVSFLTLGNLETQAYSTDCFSAELTGVNAEVSRDADIRAVTNTVSNAFGDAPGDYSIIDKGISYNNAYVGSEDKKETARVLIGNDVKLTAKRSIALNAENRGNAEARLKKNNGSVISIQHSNQPTYSWYDTSVLIGDGAQIISDGVLDVLSKTASCATSKVDANALSLLMNTGVMKGENNVNETNQVLIGKQANLSSQGDMTIRTDSTAKAAAETKFSSEFSIYDDVDIKANNTLNRIMKLRVDDGATIDSKGKLWIESIAGNGDNIDTRASQQISSTISGADANATVSSKINNTIDIRGNVSAEGDIEIKALNSGVQEDGSKGYWTYGAVNNSNWFEVYNGISSFAKANLDFYATVNINREGSTPITISSENGQINVHATNDYLHTDNFSELYSGGLTGSIDSHAEYTLHFGNQIWVDNTAFNGKSGTNLLSNFGESYFAFFKAHPYASLMATYYGYEGAYVLFSGEMNADIRTGDKSKVSGGDGFVHIANKKINYELDPDCDGSLVVTDSEETKNTHTRNEWCDFCQKEEAHDKPQDETQDESQDETQDESQDETHDGSQDKPHNEPQNEPYNEAYNETSNESQDERHSEVQNRPHDTEGKGTFVIEKLLTSNKTIEKVLISRDTSVGEDDKLIASAIYKLDTEELLTKDMTFGEDRLPGYRLWTSAMTHHDLFLLPNATRLFRGAGLDYVSEVFKGAVRGDGESTVMDIFTALNEQAFKQPIIPIGPSGSLDFSSGVFTLPELMEFELYLHELSGAWLIDRLNTGLFRRLSASQEEINDYMRRPDTDDVPSGMIVEGLSDDGETDGWRVFWLTHTPETAETEDEALICLRFSSATDEIQAYRTSVKSIAAGEEPRKVSLYLYRDSSSDQEGEEKYDILFFDTPDGEKSKVKVITDVPGTRELKTPMPLIIELRGFSLGADLPAYSLADHIFIMNDGTDGLVSMFGGAYRAAFDGDTFESDYTKIEGIRSNNLRVTIKAGQLIWNEAE
ncbi:MAG: hypothetical protein IKE58_09130 [Blautia sp.]|nr:hypothetical protein [Blautia sp.]